MKSSSTKGHIIKVGEDMVPLVGLHKRPRVIGGNDMFRKTYMITYEENMVKLVGPLNHLTLNDLICDRALTVLIDSLGFLSMLEVNHVFSDISSNN